MEVSLFMHAVFMSISAGAAFYAFHRARYVHRQTVAVERMFERVQALHRLPRGKAYDPTILLPRMTER